MTAQRRFVVIQDGARLHYAVAIAMEQAGLLERVYTPWYSAPGRIDRLLATVTRLVSRDKGQRMKARFASELPTAKVISNPWHVLRAERAHARFPSDEAFYRWESDEFARWVERRGFGKGNALFGFVRNLSPRLLRHAKACGLMIVVDQIIAPRVVELAQERIQHQRFPGWASSSPPPASDSIAELEKETWQLADRITCASEYVRTGLKECGVGDKPIHLIPYPIHTPDFPPVDRSRRTGPFVVGFVGAVGLRKGAPYFFEVAKRMASSNVQFEMVGPVQLSSQGKSQRGSVTLRGSIPRDQVPAALARFDAFLFPSTCEGSAQVIAEAMSSGLPVICSENSGSPETARHAAHRVRYDDIEGYCQHLTTCIARRGVPSFPLKPPSLDDYIAGLRQLLAKESGVPSAGARESEASPAA